MGLSKVTDRIYLEIHSNGKPQFLYARQGDRNTRYATATLLDNGDEYAIPEGASVILNAQKPDGTSIYNTLEYDNADVTVELGGQLITAAGNVKCDIEVRLGEQLITSATFFVSVSQSVRNEDAIESSSEFTLLEENLSRLEETITKAEEIGRQASESADKAENVLKSQEEFINAVDTIKGINENAKQTQAAIEALNEAVSESAYKANEAMAKAAEYASQANTAAEDVFDTRINDVNPVTDVEKTDEGLKVAWYNGDEQEFTVAASGLAFDGGYQDEEGYIHLTKDGEDVEGFDPIKVSGGGSGGSGGGSKLTFAMYSASQFSILESAEKCELEFKFLSIDTDTQTETGSGILAITVNGVVRENKQIAQGDHLTTDVLSYLGTGSNTVKLTITDSYGSIASRSVTITKETFSLEWNLSTVERNTGSLAVYITPTGSGTKTIYLLVDGEAYSEETVTTSGRRLSKTITGLKHGSHTIECYGEVVINGAILQSNRLRCSLAQTDEISTTPVIAGYVDNDEVSQYTTFTVTYRVVDPLNNPTDITFTVNGVAYETQSVDQSTHEWTYRPTVSGSLTVEIKCGTQAWTQAISVTSLGNDIQEVTDDLELKVEPSTITDLASWKYGTATITLSDGFDTTNGGIVTDSEGIKAIKIQKGDRLTLNYNLFSSDPKRNGKNFKIIYKIDESSDFNAEAISCLSGGIGLLIRSNDTTLTSEQSTTYLHTCEGYKTEYEVNIKPDTDSKLITVYETGCPSKATLYSTNDSFTQTNPVGITFGSDDCAVWIYLIRSYTRDLTNEEIKANYACDGKDGNEIINRHDRNQIYDSAGNIDVDKVAELNPECHILTWHAENISIAKSNKITGRLTHKYVNGGTSHSWTATGVVDKVQGTSSEAYAKDAGGNQDFEAKNGFDFDDGTHSDVYCMTENSIGVNYFNFKANVASQEHINNMLLSERYNTYQPYIRQARQDDSRVRDTVEGHMCILFFHNTGSSSVDVGPMTVQPDETVFYSLGNLNNSKKNNKAFAYEEIVIEQLNNTSDQTRGKSDDLTNFDDNFEFRYISDDVSEDDAKALFNEALSLIVACNPDGATNATLAKAVTFPSGQRFTTDSRDYRLQKWKYEAPDIFEMDSILFHQIFTLVFTMVDNRAKNMFWSYGMDNKKWKLVFSYDHDTGMGNDNEGGLTLNYGYLDTDLIGTKSVFNASDSTIYLLNTEVFWDDMVTMYTNLENEGCWDLDTFADECDAAQDMVCEAVWMEDAQRKDILPMQNMGTTAYIPMLNGKKRLQRRKFLHFQRAFMSSYFGGTYSKGNSATIRGYTPTSWSGVKPESKMTVTPYCDLFVTVRAGSVDTKARAYAGQPVTLKLGVEQMNDTEIYPRSASFLQDLGDLSPLYPGYCDLAQCDRLKRAEIGSSVEGYQNTNLTEVSVVNAAQLVYLNVENCPSLQQAIDTTNNVMLKELYTRGSGVTGVTFAKGGNIETAYLNGVSSLYASGLKKLKELTLESYENLTSLTVEDSPSINSFKLAGLAANLARIRMTDVDWTCDTSGYDTLMRLYRLAGIDEDGYNTTQAILTGEVYFTTVSRTKYEELVKTITTLQFSYGEMLAEYTVTFKNDDGTVLYTEKVELRGSAKDPVKEGYIGTPQKASTIDNVYAYYGWDRILDLITEDTTITAVYTESQRYNKVEFVDYDGTVLESLTVKARESVTYSGDDLSRDGYIWMGWDFETDNVIDDMTVTAQYSYPQLPSEVLDLDNYDYAYSDDEGDSSAYTFEQLYAIIKMKQTSKYLPIAAKIKMKVNANSSISDTEIVFNLHATGHYELVDGGMSNADFYMSGLLAGSRRMNVTNTNAGGWDASEGRAWLNKAFFEAFPIKWRSLISKSVTLANAGSQSVSITKSEDYLRIPSQAEVGFDTTSVPYKNEVSSEAQETAFSQYTNSNSRIKKTYNGEGSAQFWWLRSARASDSTTFTFVGSSGNSNGSGATTAYFWCVGFSC